MSNDPFADQPYEQGPDPSVGPPPTPGAGWGSDPGAGAAVRSASVGKRVGAYFLDALGIFIVYVIVGVIVLGINPTGYLGSLIVAAVGIAYFALMEAGSGQTIAKKLLGIKVVSADGSPVTMQAAVMRRLPFYIGAVIPVIGGLVSLVLVIAILVTAIQDESAHRGLHDNWAGTRVIDA